MPERYGPYTTCYNRFVQWRKAGVWERLFEAIASAYADEVQMVDSWTIRVHLHAANGRKGSPDAFARDRPDGRCMGRSRGRMTTKLHALVDARGLPIRVKLTQGQAHETITVATIVMIQAMLPGMRDHRAGVIVNVSPGTTIKPQALLLIYLSARRR